MSRVIVFCGLIILMISFPLQGSSLWQSDSQSLFSDPIAQGEGDLLTVVIKENTEAYHEADTQTGQGLGFELNPGVFLSDLFAGLEPRYSDHAESGGRTERSGSIVGEITVEIVEVLDSGNFRIEGIKGITVDGEHQEIKLTGIIRPQDIEKDNTIESSRLANVDISYTGSGVVADKQRRSILEWLLNWIF